MCYNKGVASVQNVLLNKQFKKNAAPRGKNIFISSIDLANKKCKTAVSKTLNL